MIGSISKIRPCGHSHYYKYHTCTNNEDIIRVAADYKNDIDDEGCWEFSLENLKKLNNDAFKNAKITKFKAKTPNLVTANKMFGSDSTTRLKELEMDFNNLENCEYLFNYSMLNKYPENFNPKATSFGYLFGNYALDNIAKNTGNYVVPFYEVINNAVNASSIFYNNKEVTYNERYSFSNATNATLLFSNNNFSECPPNLSFKNIIYLSSTFNNVKNLTSFQTIDEMSNLSNAYGAFNDCTSLRELYPDYEAFSFPKLSTADNMFKSCQLDKSSVIKLSNALPTHESGTHKITIGIHVDFKCDKDIQYKLRELSSAYTPTLSLDVEPETYKGWTLTVEWNGNATGNEIINPSLVEKFELDTITLPNGYVRCEYLESDTNNQFIDTGIIPTDSIGVWQIAKKLTSTTDGYNLAAKNNSVYYYPPVITLYSGGTYHGYNTTSQWSEVPKNGTIFESWMKFPINGVVENTANIIANGETLYTRNLSGSLKEIGYSLYLFGRNYNGTLEKPWNGRIYRAKISEGTEIIRDFIPALDPDGKPCMYEIIEGKPYYNAATSGDDFLYKVYEDYIMAEP